MYSSLPLSSSSLSLSRSFSLSLSLSLSLLFSLSLFLFSLPPVFLPPLVLLWLCQSVSSPLLFVSLFHLTIGIRGAFAWPRTSETLQKLIADRNIWSLQEPGFAGSSGLDTGVSCFEGKASNARGRAETNLNLPQTRRKHGICGISTPFTTAGPIGHVSAQDRRMIRTMTL
jgi:hypothetical protein